TQTLPGGSEAPSSAPPTDDGASEPDGEPVPQDEGPTHPATPAPSEPAAAWPPAAQATSAPGATAPPGVAAPVSAPAAHTDLADESYVVRPGDSLWAVAARHLGPGATVADVAAEWPRWYEANRDVVGADPGLIHPGQLLQAPEPKDVP
ncbi:LysM peptidoglycan-binding domain-containing protein, partial [Georgenia sp. 311]